MRFTRRLRYAMETRYFQLSVKTIVPITVLIACGMAIPYAGVAGSTAAIDDGEIDNAFNPGGTGAGPQDQSSGQAVAVHSPSGQILFAGNFFTYNNQDVPDHIVRLTTAGVPDSSFNAGGKGASQTVHAVAAQGDGKVVIGGAFTTYNDELLTPDAIIRLNADGKRDTTFNSGGSGTDGVVNAVAVQTDGKVIIGCTCSSYNGNAAASDRIMRLNVDGSLDTGFNPGGAGLSGVPSAGLATVNALALQSDGKIIIGGNFSIYNGDAAANNHVMRLNSDGTRDATFNPDGVGAIAQVRAVAVQPDGKIIIGGDFDRYNGNVSFSRYIMRLNADGTPDTTFNAGGTGPLNGQLAASIRSVAVQTDGKIVIGGSFTSYNGDASASDRIMRLNANGTRETTFNAGGEGSDGNVNAMALQLNGYIVIAGNMSSYNGNASVPDRIFRLRSSNVIATPTPTPTATPTPTPTPTPSPTPVKPAKFDYDADGLTDVGIYRPSNGIWNILRSRDGFYGQQFGAAGDKIVPADYDGDGKTDLAVFRPSSGVWFIYNSSNGSSGGGAWGDSTDIPAPGDFDGDGRADIAIFRPSTGSWWLKQTTAGIAVVQFGVNGDLPQVGDYDGDKKSDLAVFRPSTGIWFIRRSTGGDVAAQWGEAADKIVPADYDGDGKTDIAVYRPSTGVWFITNSGGGYTSTQFGLATDIPVPGDYDGDGRSDLAIFRPSDGKWWINGTKNGVYVVGWGLTGDKPTPSAFQN